MRVVWARTERVLQLGDERRGVGGPELVLKRVRLRDDRFWRRRSRRVAQRAAEQEGRARKGHGCGREDEVCEAWSWHGLLRRGRARRSGGPFARARLLGLLQALGVVEAAERVGLVGEERHVLPVV